MHDHSVVFACDHLLGDFPAFARSRHVSSAILRIPCIAIAHRHQSQLAALSKKSRSAVCSAPLMNCTTPKRIHDLVHATPCQMPPCFFLCHFLYERLTSLFLAWQRPFSARSPLCVAAPSVDTIQ